MGRAVAVPWSSKRTQVSLSKISLRLLHLKTIENQHLSSSIILYHQNHLYFLFVFAEFPHLKGLFWGPMRPLQRRIPAMRDAPQQHPGKSYPKHWGYLGLKRSHKGLISGQILIVGGSTDSYRGLFNPYCFGSTVRRVPSDFHEPCSMLAKHPLVQPTQVAFVAHLLSNMAWAWSVLPEPDKSNYSTGAAEVWFPLHLSKRNRLPSWQL